jgi:hypothetical protein
VQSALDSLVTFIVMVMSLLKPSLAKLCVSRQVPLELSRMMVRGSVFGPPG